LKIAAKPLHMETCLGLLLTTYRNSSSLCSTAPSPIPYDLRLATIPHDWHSRVPNDFKVIQGQRFSCHVKGLMRYFLLVIISYLSPFLRYMYIQFSVEKRTFF